MTPNQRWEIIHGDCLEVMRTLAPKSVSIICTDPPYSAHVHSSVMSSGRATLPDTKKFSCRENRVVDLGFGHLDSRTRRVAAYEFARLVQRWVLVFSDVESSWLWRLSLSANHLEYIKTAVWLRIGGAPQFTGDRPASAIETITLAHPKGRKRWNGGGKAGVYEAPIVANRIGQRGSRVHPTQKSEELMVALLTDFSEPDEIVLDPFAGSGSTGVAALRLGRRFIGIERDGKHAAIARERLSAESQNQSLSAYRAKQEVMFK